MNNTTETSKVEPKDQLASKAVETKPEAATLQIEGNSTTINKKDETTKSNDVTAETKKNIEQTKTEISTTDNNEINEYTFTAQPGDSFTKLAQDAIKQYSATNQITLQTKEVEKAAARLAYNAGSPFLEINQSVNIASSDIATLISAKPQITNATNSEKPNPTEQSAPTSPYSFTAVSGDNYSKLARKAIKEYKTANKNILTKAESVAAETFIISNAGFPNVAVGQSVMFTNDVIKNAVDKSKSLSPIQIAHWQTYANSVIL